MTTPTEKRYHLEAVQPRAEGGFLAHYGGPAGELLVNLPAGARPAEWLTIPGIPEPVIDRTPALDAAVHAAAEFVREHHKNTPDAPGAVDDTRRVVDTAGAFEWAGSPFTSNRVRVEPAECGDVSPVLSHKGSTCNLRPGHDGMHWRKFYYGGGEFWEHCAALRGPDNSRCALPDGHPGAHSSENPIGIGATLWDGPVLSPMDAAALRRHEAAQAFPDGVPVSSPAEGEIGAHGPNETRETAMARRLVEVAEAVWGNSTTNVGLDASTGAGLAAVLRVIAGSALAPIEWSAEQLRLIAAALEGLDQ